MTFAVVLITQTLHRWHLGRLIGFERSVRRKMHLLDVDAEGPTRKATLIHLGQMDCSPR